MKMEFLDFLKYGAIGISLALAILSYRLLSKEQDKELERPIFLKSIRSYMFLTVFLSIFFGLLEILSPNAKKSDSYLNTIWSKHFEQYKDSTSDQKFQTISNYIKNAKIKIDTLKICEQYISELKKCKSKLEVYNKGFYSNIVKLKEYLKASPDGWTNLRFATDSKTEILNLLKEIFICLGHDYEGYTYDKIIAKWESLKINWTQQRLSYVFNSDITELIKIYLNTYKNN